MKSSFAFIGTLAVGIGIGLLGGPLLLRSGDGEPKVAVMSAETAENALLSDYLGGRHVESISAQDALDLVARLRELEMWTQASEMETERAKFKLQLLLEKLPLPVLEQLMEAAREYGPAAGRVDTMVGHFLARDREKALAWVSRQPNADYLKPVVIDQLARIDIAHAISLYQQGLLERERPTIKNLRALEEADFSIAREHARKGVDEFFEYFDERPSRDVHGMLVRAPNYLPEKDIPAFVAKVHERASDGTYRRGTMEQMLSALASRYPVEAGKWFNKLDKETSRRAIGMEARMMLEYEIIGNLCYRGKFAEAAEFLKEGMPAKPGQQKEFVTSRAELYLVKYPEVVGAMAAALSDEDQLEPVDLRHLPAPERFHHLLDKAQLLRTPSAQAIHLVEELDRLPSDKPGELPPDEADFATLSRRLSLSSIKGEELVNVQKALERLRGRVAPQAAEEE